MKTKIIEKNQLIEVEYELNHKDIIRFRTLMLQDSGQGLYTMLSPIRIENAYAFKAGDVVDITAPIMDKDSWNTLLHFKAKVLKTGKEAKFPVLYLKRISAMSTSTNIHFYSVQFHTDTLLECSESSQDVVALPGVIISVSPENIHILHNDPVQTQTIYKIPIPIGAESVIASAITQETIINKHSKYKYATYFNIHEEDDFKKNLFLLLVEYQRKFILASAPLTWIQIQDRRSQGQALVLEHLVEASWMRKTLNFMVVLGWCFAAVAMIQIILALPPKVDFFDRMFRLNISSGWNTDILNYGYYFTIASFTVCIIALILNGIIYYRSNTRFRYHLIALALLNAYFFLLTLKPF